MIQKTANDKDPLQNVSRHTQNDKKILEGNYLNNTQTFGVCNFGLCLLLFFLQNPFAICKDQISAWYE